MKIAILTDLHFGSRQDSIVLMKNQHKFFNETFFPYINNPSNKIEGVAILGDVFDRRKQTNHLSLAFAKVTFFDPLYKTGLPAISLVGNHDAFYRNSLKVNSLSLMVNHYPKLHVIAKPEVFTGFGTDVLCLPWICEENQEESEKLLKVSNAKIAFGHFELNGFKMYSGSPFMTGGMDPDILSRFSLVLSGHFHHSSQKNNIRYLGTPYEMTWQDYGDKKGFYVLNTETLEMEHIENPHHMFKVIVYDDVVDNLSIEFDDTSKDQFIKVIVQNKTNPVAFEEYLRSVEMKSPADLQVVDKTQVSIDTDDLDSASEMETEDVGEYIVSLVDQYATKPINDDVLNITKKRLTEWYHAARQN